jgi:hypothetical protein
MAFLVEICFAFIEFTRPDSVDEIIKAYVSTPLSLL